MGKNALMQVVTSISPHIRDGHAVRGYQGERSKATKLEPLKKQSSVTKESFQQDYDSRTKGIFDADGDPHESIPTDVLEHHVKGLFASSSESGVDPIINSHPSFLQNVYDIQTTHATGVDLGSAKSRDALTLLLDKENTQSVVNSVDALEKIFQTRVGSQTERVDPFTFKFRQVENVQPDAYSVGNKLFDYLSEILPNFADKHASALSGSKMKVDHVNMLDDILTSQQKGEKAFGGNLGVSSLMNNLRGLKSTPIPQQSHQKLNQFLSDNGMNSLGLYGGSPDKVHEVMVKRLKSAENFAGKDDIVKFFRTTEASSLVPAFNFLREKHALPTFMSESPEAFKSLRGMAEKVGQLLKASTGTFEGDIYVSRNPMNILTMAPEKTAPSCQSLTGAKTKGSPTQQQNERELSITSDNINIPGSYNTQNTNDFVMYTLNKDGQKDARMSFSYNNDTKEFENYEAFNVYGTNRSNRELLSNFTDRQGVFTSVRTPQYTEGEMKENIPIWGQIGKVERAVSNAAIDFNDYHAAGDIEGMTRVFDNLKKGYSMQRNKRSGVGESFLDSMNDVYYDTVSKHKSLLYGSMGHSVVSGSKYMCETFGGELKSLDVKYRETFNQVSTLMENRRRLK